MQKMKKQLTLRACALLLVFCSLAILSSPTRAQVTAEQLLTLPTERIVELAMFGEPEAQFWVATAVYTGLLRSPRPYYEAHDWFIAAAEQGHVEATFRVSDMAKHYEELRSKAVALLLPLARSGSGRAHYHLRRQYNFLDERLLADHHLKEAADLGYRPAMLTYGMLLALSDRSEEPRNIARAAEMLVAAIRLSPAPEEMENDEAFHGTCNAYNNLIDIYSGEQGYFEDGQHFVDTTLQDPAKEIEMLEAAADFGCVLESLLFAERLFEGNGVEQNIEKAAFLVDYVLSADGPDGLLYPSATFFAVEVKLALGDFDGAREHILNLPPQDEGQFYARENLVSRATTTGLVYGPALPFCRHHGIASVDCHDFVVGLMQ